MNDKKICFITCVNNESYYEISKSYIKNLEVPIGYEIETIEIRDAKSMTSGYNKAIKLTDAKYKVYIHQDVYIVNKHFIKAILKLFENKNIGLIGVAGCKNLPSNAIWWEGKMLYGEVYDTAFEIPRLLKFNEPVNEYEVVECIDGLIMITQYDISWDEVNFNGWHFYDISQSERYKKLGYDVIVPRQESCWCFHDCGMVINMQGYDENRIKFLKRYK
ncbi:MAG: glycosyltransferase family protein [Paraclostridium sp.]